MPLSHCAAHRAARAPRASGLAAARCDAESGSETETETESGAAAWLEPGRDRGVGWLIGTMPVVTPGASAGGGSMMASIMHMPEWFSPRTHHASLLQPPWLDLG